MINYRIAHSQVPDVSEAISNMAKSLSSVDPGLVVFFASAEYDPERVASIMADTFPGAQTVGCTTAGEMVSNRMLSGSIVAMACSKKAIPTLKVEVLENISTDKQTVVKAFKNVGRYFGTDISRLSPTKYVGMLLIDGISHCEEYINDQIGNYTNILFVGGSTATTKAKSPTYIYANGKAYIDAALMVIMSPTDGFSVLKSQSMRLTNSVLTPTKVDEAKRRVYEFDHKPASRAYAEAIGISEQELPNYFTKNPLGLVFDEQHIFVRNPHHIEDTAVDFYCAIKEGQQLSVLQSGNIVADTYKDLEQAWANNRDLKAIIEFNCMSRMKELWDKDQAQEYAALFRIIPTISFGTFGESYIGHMNQTSTMLLLN